MRILSTHGLPGMVRSRAASEIPAFVAMDWVDGPTLKEAVRAGRLRDWKDVLEIGLQLAHCADGPPTSGARTTQGPAPFECDAAGVLDGSAPGGGGSGLRFVLAQGFGGAVRRAVLGLGIPRAGAAGGDPRRIDEARGRRFVRPGHDAVFPRRGGRDPIAEQHRHTDWNRDGGERRREFEGSAVSALPQRFAR